MLPSPGEILIIGLVLLLLVAGKYFYQKLKEGRDIYKRSRRDHDRDR